MPSITNNLRLSITERETNKSFLDWRLQQDGPDDSNMIKLDQAWGDMDAKVRGALASVGHANAASSAADMTDTSKVYIYVGETTASLTQGNWYYYDEDDSAWKSGGVYNAEALVTDDTLTLEGEAADAKATGEMIVVNGTSSEGTRVNITTTNEDVEIATMDDVNDLKNALDVVVEKETSANFFPGYTQNGGINNTTGEDRDDQTNYVRTDFIPLDTTKSTIYILRESQPYGVRLFYYDSTKTFIQNNQIWNGTSTSLSNHDTIPNNAAYVRTMRDNTVDTWFMLSYTEENSYLPYAPTYAMKGEIVHENNLDDNLQKKINNVKNAFYNNANLLDLSQATRGSRMNSDGTITSANNWIISDWIDIDKLNSKTIYFSESVSVTEIADATKANIDYLSNKTSIDLSSYTSAKYFRISCTCTVAFTLIVADYSGATNKNPGYIFDKEIANLNIDKAVNEWYKNNILNVENVLIDSTYNFYQCSGYKDYSKVRDSLYSICLPSASGETIDLRITKTNAVNLIGVQKIIVKFFLVNASNVSSVTFSITGTSSYSNTRSSGFVEGWNEFVFLPAQSETLTDNEWSTTSNFRIYWQGTGAFTVYLSAINLDRMEKGKLIFVDDHGYHGFKTLAYPLLKAAGQPVTWAINPGRLGDVISTSESILTQEDIDELAYDAFSEFSFHNWNPSGNPTETMTPAELRQDYQKCITYLKKNGICPQHIWRAALTQNRADNWWVAQDMVEAAATHTTGATYTTWPFLNPYNVPRYLIHGRSQADIDVFFDRVRLTHCTLVLYTHGCVVTRDPNISSDSLHCTVAEIEYLCSKITAGVNGGWLEPTTFNRLKTMEEHGMFTLSTT